MAKSTPSFRIRTFGTYSKWDADSKELPTPVENTTHIPAIVDIEFGFVVNVKGGKNQKLRFCIDHPQIKDAAGDIRPPFTGDVYVKSNDWNFFLGDTIWEPLDDKLGHWHLSLKWNDKVVAEKTFLVLLPE